MLTSLLLWDSSLKAGYMKYKLNGIWLTWISQASVLRLAYFLAQHLANVLQDTLLTFLPDSVAFLESV